MLGVFFFFNFYWSIVALQCCVGFYCAAKCISYTYTYISSFLAEFPVLYSKFSLVIYFIFVCVCVCVRAHTCSLSHFRLFATPWTASCMAPLSMGFSRQEYWNGLPFPSPEDLLYPGIIPLSPMSPALAGRFFTTEPPGKPNIVEYVRQSQFPNSSYPHLFPPWCSYICSQHLCLYFCFAKRLPCTIFPR